VSSYVSATQNRQKENDTIQAESVSSYVSGTQNRTEDVETDVNTEYRDAHMIQKRRELEINRGGQDPDTMNALTGPEFHPVSSVEDRLGGNGPWRCIELLVDSGAVDHVGDPREFPEYRLKPSAGSIAGLCYIAANKGRIANQGEQHLRLCSLDGCFGFNMKIQSAAVSRPILSVAKLVEHDNDVSFAKTGGTIRNFRTGQTTHLERKHGVYVLRAWLRTEPDPGNRPEAGEGAADFTRQV